MRKMMKMMTMGSLMMMTWRELIQKSSRLQWKLGLILLR
jgi:hypothetical protein